MGSTPQRDEAEKAANRLFNVLFHGDDEMMTLDMIQNAHQRYSEPIVVFFEDTETFDIIPRPFLSDVSWCDKGRPLKVCGDLGDFGESPVEMFEQLNDYLREVG